MIALYNTFQTTDVIKINEIICSKTQNRRIFFKRIHLIYKRSHSLFIVTFHSEEVITYFNLQLNYDFLY